MTIPGTSYFVVGSRTNSCCQYLDYWCMDTSGNVCFKNRANGGGVSAAFDEEFSPGGLAWDPVRNGVVDSYFDNNCRLYANFYCRCQSGTCLHFSTGSQVGPTCSGFFDLVGTNSLFYNPVHDRFVKFFYSTSSGQIFKATFRHCGGGNFSCDTNATNANITSGAASGSGISGPSVHYDCDADAYHLTTVSSSDNKCIRQSYMCLKCADGCIIQCNTIGLYNTGDSRSPTTGYDPLRKINVYPVADCACGCYGTLVSSMFSSSTDEKFEQNFVCTIYDCTANLRSQSNGSAALYGFMDTGYSNNMILSYGFFNGSSECFKLSQLVWGSSGYVETLDLMCGQAFSRMLRGNPGAHVPCAGWSVVGYTAYCCSCYFLRTFKAKVVS
jgi:hypothetical protein